MLIRSVPKLIIFVILNIVFLFILIFLHVVLYPFQVFRYYATERRHQPISAHVTVTSSEPEDEKTKDTIVLIHGFPDSPALWDPTVRRLNSLGYRCLVVALPGSKGEKYEDTIDMDIIVEEVHSSITAQMQQIKSVTIIGHDWGAFFSQALRQKYPQFVHRMILLDVPGIMLDSPGAFHTLCMTSYQLVLLFCHLLGQPIGTYALRFYVSSIAELVFPYRARPLTELRSDMAWYYYCCLKMVIQKIKEHLNDLYNDVVRNFLFRNASIPCTTNQKSVQDCARLQTQPLPILFIYGSKKPVYLHDQGYIDLVRSMPYGVCEGWDCGHWIQIEKEKEWLATLGRWLRTTSSVVSK